MTGRAQRLTFPASEYVSDVDIRSITSSSDYGSDIDLEDVDEGSILTDVLAVVKEQAEIGKNAAPSEIQLDEGSIEADRQHMNVLAPRTRPHILHRAKGKKKNNNNNAAVEVQSATQRSSFQYPGALLADHGSVLWWSFSVSQEAPSLPALDADAYPTILPLPATKAADLTDGGTVPPIERFRTKPKKPLSVTDLVSPAWCELQYLYTLSIFGRKPRTKAMQTGSKIHQSLEDEVHMTIPIQVQSKEDRFGLRLWNSINGLRCLRETGLTRELEVWGVIEGQVVIGVIDALSYQSPDPAYGKRVEKSRSDIDSLLPGQLNISKTVAKASNPHATVEMCVGNSQPNLQVYLTDVKTRSVRSVPAGASLRPTWMQLMLYRKLLESLSLNSVDAETLFARYDLAPLQSFSTEFMQEIGGISSNNEATLFPNLLSLWSLLITELQAALPAESLSPILRAEFRYAKTGEVIGSELTVYEPAIIDEYIATVMAWWKGDREAKGVEIEEAFKCKTCEFAERCSWREAKVEEATLRSRRQREMKGRNTV